MYLGVELLRWYPRNRSIRQQGRRPLRPSRQGSASTPTTAYRIDSWAKLDNLDTLLRLHISRRGEQEYEFDLPGLSPLANLELSRRINGYRRECACFWGGLGMGATCIALTSGFFLNGGSFTDIGVRELVGLAAALAGAALLGKLLGLVWVHFQMIRLVQIARSRAAAANL